ncbi:MAG: DUF3179 domain-containing protein [Thermoguttaceae bacterium]
MTVRREEHAVRGYTMKQGRHTAAWATLFTTALAVTHSFVSGAQPPGSQFVQYRASPSFDLRNAIIPKNEIRSGGPPKDGIPALTNPAVIRAQDAAHLNAMDRVAGVAIGGEARAYPLKILNYHEVVNDPLGGVPIAVTYCPLCDSVVAFDRRTEGGVLEFGVSGLLYNSNVLMYDRGGRPESLWSQVGAQGVSGPGARKDLKTLPVELTSWQDWQTRHPNTTILSDRTGHVRNYQVNQYQTYFARPNLMFPARPMSNQLPAKAPVLGVWTGGKARAYPLSTFDPRGEMLNPELDGKRFTLIYDGQHKTARVASADEGIQWMYSFWFAWCAFRPHTDVYEGER